MANLKLHHYLIGIFTSIILIFAMSHNASAVNFDLSNYSLVSNSIREENTCRLQNGEVAPTGLASFTFDSVQGIQLLKEIQTSRTFDLKKGDIIEFYFIVATQQNYTTTGSTYFINEVSNANGLITLDYETIDDYSSLDFVTLDNEMINENAFVLYDFYAYYRVSKVFRITQLVPSDGTYNLGLNITSTSVNRYIFNFNQRFNDSFYFSIKNFNIYRRSETQENKEVEEKTQEAVDGSEDAGNSSSSSAQSGSASLLNVIGAFAGIITSAQPTNCQINGNMGNLNIGQIDLCANPVPSFVQIIGSIILVCLVIPFVVIMFNRFISIFRSFQS